VYRTLVAGCVLWLFGCGKDPHNFRITAQNRDTFMDEIKDMKGLTVDEARLLVAYNIRRGVGKAFGTSSEDPVGKTVGELLVELKKQGGYEGTEAEREKRLADEAKVRAEAQAAELRKSIDLTVLEKGFRRSDTNGGPGNQITIKCTYQNSSAKDIRAFRGKIQFADLFGTEIYTTVLTISDPVTKLRWELNPAAKTAHKANALLAYDANNGTTRMFSGGWGLPLQVTLSLAVKPAALTGVMEGTTENLAQQTINGVTAQGFRNTMTIPKGQIGNNRDIKIMNERWFSDDLQILVKSVSLDPRFGDSTYQVTRVAQGAPDPALFQIPSDYTVMDLQRPTLKRQ